MSTGTAATRVVRRFFVLTTPKVIFNHGKRTAKNDALLGIPIDRSRSSLLSSDTSDSLFRRRDSVLHTMLHVLQNV